MLGRKKSDGVYHLLFDYPFPENETGVIEYGGETVGYFLPDRIIIFKKVDFEALFHILKDYAQIPNSTISNRFISAPAKRELVIAVGDRGYGKIVKHIFQAMQGDISSLNLLQAFAEGDNEKSEESEKALMCVLGFLLNFKAKNQEQIEKEFPSLKKEILKFIKRN
jgi:hypothetical protein